MKGNNRAFTLVEILLTISLIAVLTTLGFAAFTNTQKVGRNSKRTQDMKSIQTALESYHSDNDSYPASCEPGSQYLPAGLPSDPSPSKSYVHSQDCSASYCFCASLENQTGNATDSNCSYGSGANATFFCVSSLQ